MALVGTIRSAVRSAAAATLVFLVGLYQKTLSPWLGGQCRYLPTCSDYFILAVRKHGPWRGAAKGLWRVLRCSPIGGHGYDPP